jgi:hypothetical protein
MQHEQIALPYGEKCRSRRVKKNHLEYGSETTSFPATESTRELRHHEPPSLKALCGGGARGE